MAPGRTYAVYRQDVDDTRGNAHTAWVEMDRPPALTARAQVALQEAARLNAERLDDLDSGDGRVELWVELAAHSVCLLELVPV
jgi:beta-xylosidase